MNAQLVAPESENACWRDHLSTLSDPAERSTERSHRRLTEALSKGATLQDAHPSDKPSARALRPARCGVQAEGSGCSFCPPLSVCATVREALAWAARQFPPLNTDTPRLDAELLLAHCLGWDRARLHAYPEQTLSDEQHGDFEILTHRHAQGEPIAYILGYQEFFDLDFFVDNRVLIPRPETELLVEEAIVWIRMREPGGERLVAADVGTGSGAIAVSLAVARPRLRVYATDVSTAALKVTAHNADRHGVAERVRLLHGDLLDPLPEPVHLITANMPYVSEPEMALLPPHIARFEPRLALDGGPNGLAVIERLLAQARTRLRPEGVILLEIGATQGNLAVARARSYFLAAHIQVRQDYAAHDRFLIIQT